MRPTDWAAWVLSVCAEYLRLSQAKTLAALVDAAMRCERASLAHLGRALGGMAKHQIKRAWRFIANARIEPADAMRGPLRKLLQKHKPGKPLLISLDWTDVRRFQTLVAAVVFRGRAIPVCWASCLKHVYDGHRSRNAFEESLLLVLRSMLPPEQRVILLADRGFGRTELARFCQNQRIDYVIRINPDVHVRCASYRGKLLDYPVRRATCKLLQSVDYRSENSVRQNIVVRWMRGLPKHRDECWFLMTSLSQGPARISNLYAKRMEIEELFRDQKNKRNGWSLRDTRITKPDRLDRMLLILALAYLLLVLVGLLMLKQAHPGHWSSASQNDCSVFTIGRTMLRKCRCPIGHLIRQFLAQIAAVGKWG